MKKNTTRSEKNLHEVFISGLQQAEIKPGVPYLVGVSGGIDSIFLAYMLQQCQIKFAIAHLNHSIRENADQDAVFVAEFSNLLGVDFFCEKVDVPLFAEQMRLALEEAARVARYQYLMEIADKHHFYGVIVAHHADDQVETFLMHLLRGSGIAGMAAMGYREILPSFSPNIPILRPMLGIWREEIIQYHDQNHLNYIIDETNTDIRFFRNRLRHELIPLLQAYNVNAKQHFWQTSMIAQEAAGILESYREAAWKDILIHSGDDLLIWDQKKYDVLEDSGQRLLLRFAISQLLPTMRDFGYELTNQFQQYCQHPPSGSYWQVVGDVFTYLHRSRYYIGSRKAIDKAVREQYPQWETDPLTFVVDPDFSVALGNGYHLQFEIKPIETVNEKKWSDADSDEAWVDADLLQHPLIVRSYQEGDRFSPFGMSGKTAKLSDYFIDNKIPQPARCNFPFVCDKNGIVWVVGERIDDGFQITSNTKRVLHLQLIRGSV
jgi:tRNA(Ile)-lysidine synthase